MARREPNFVVRFAAPDIAPLLNNLLSPPPTPTWHRLSSSSTSRARYGLNTE